MQRPLQPYGPCSLAWTAGLLQRFYMMLGWALCSLAEAALLQQQIDILKLPCAP